MMPKFSVIHSGLLLFILSFSEPGRAQTNSSLNRKIENDTAIIFRKFNNGFTYYIKSIGNDHDIVTICFAVKAGTFMEDDDQVEVAHLLEHLAFDGSKHFTDVWSLYDKAGIRKGLDVNAGTGSDMTYYWANIPRNDTATINKTLLLARDIVSDLTLKQTDFNRERNVVLEETRRSTESLERQTAQFRPILYNHTGCVSKLKSREDREKGLLNLEYNALGKFYESWYRPDLCSIIVVGNVDKGSIEKKVKQLFGNIPQNDRSPIDISCEVALQNKNQYLLLTDPDVQQYEVRIYNKRKRRPVVTYSDALYQIYLEAYDYLVNHRINEYARSMQPYNNLRHSTLKNEVPGLEIAYTYFEAEEQNLRSSFIEALKKMHQIRDFGFTQAEFDTAIVELGKRRQMIKNSTFDIALTYLEHYRYREALPAPEQSDSIFNSLIRVANVTDLNKLTKFFQEDSNRDIVVFKPESYSEKMPSDEEIINWLGQSDRDIGPFVLLTKPNKNVLKSPSQSAPPTTWKLVSSHNGVDAYVFASGAKVLIRKTIDNPSSKIAFNAYRRRGATSFCGDDRIFALITSEAMERVGVGELPKREVDEYMLRNRLVAHHYIYRDHSVIKGEFSINSFDSLMLLVYNFCNEVSRDSSGFSKWKQQKRQEISYNQRDREAQLQRILAKQSSQTATYADLSPLSLSHLTYKKAKSIFEDCFSDLNQFTFVFSGGISSEFALPIISKYLNSENQIPKQSVAGCDQTEVNLPFNTQEKKVILYSGKEKDRATVRIQYNFKINLSFETKIHLDVTAAVLQSLLTSKLRQELGSVYSVFVYSHINSIASKTSVLEISFDCSPNNVERLVTETDQVLKKMATDSPERDLILGLIKPERDRLTDQLGSNIYWADYIMIQTFTDSKVQTNDNLLLGFDTITPYKIRKIMASILKKGSRTTAILLPSQLN